MIRIRQLRRLVSISLVLARYRLDDVLQATRLFRPARVIRVLAPWRSQAVKDDPLGRRLRLALDDLGPIFVKLGQMLSTRRDLLPPEIANELAMLQDQVAPFPGAQARAQIELALGQPIDAVFARFDDNALASASVAQVHSGTLKNGDEVVVKVLRPDINESVRRDLELIHILAGLAERYWSAAPHVRPQAIVDELEKTLYHELNLQREAANASQLRRNFADDDELYVPSVYWDLTSRRAMVMERVSGIAIDDVAALKRANVDLKVLAERGIRIFYTQVFRDNFFHADMHPGNILVNADDPANPTYILMDFGIVGAMPPEHLHYLAENFLAFFNQDYHRVAALHIESGWIPDNVRVDEVEAAVRTVCEPQFARPLAEISFAQVLFQLFEVARQFHLNAQPELLLLQKTLLNIEGVGRHVYAELDIWTTSKPILQQIMRQRLGIDAATRDLQEHLPGWLAKTPKVPGMIFDYLEKAQSGRLETRLRSKDLDALRLQLKASDKRTVWAIFGAALGIMTVLLWALEPSSAQYRGWPAGALLLGTSALLCAWRALSSGGQTRR